MKEEQGRNAKRARRSRSEGKGRGLVSVLLGTVLLAVLGFGLGIAAGLVLEEPKLLLDYLTGRTTSAPLEEAREARDRAPAEPTPLAEASAPPAPVESAPATEPVQGEESTPPVASSPPVEPPVEETRSLAEAETSAESGREATSEPAPRAGGYSVQVGALADSAGAEQLAAKLRKRGFSVYVAPSAEAGAKRWRVRVGPVATREEAQSLAKRLETEKFPTWVLAEGPR
jgi:DedD protein